MFVRAGSILPMESGLTYAEEVPDTPFEFHLYPLRHPGQKALSLHRILYYEDDGDGYGYESGTFQQIPVTWDEKENLFSIGSSPFRFRGGIAGRDIRLVFAGGGEQLFRYRGEEHTEHLSASCRSLSHIPEKE